MSKPKYATRNSVAFAASDFVGKRVVHVSVSPVAFVQSKWTYATERREVILMAVSKSWAMVRRPSDSTTSCDSLGDRDHAIVNEVNSGS